MAQKRRVQRSDKLAEDGSYARFPGITVVCNMTENSDAEGALGLLPSVLSSLETLGPLFAPLPATSYHVTTLDVCTQRRHGLDDQAWETMLR